ncbi:hypothetical protein ABN028_25950 [Actinopolymorpha sp. B17G11]|uniref:hypothetical protein n=1 Tax=Actinopolymorpha sp. B17G11 TaxID=3160861 RepID=UPI0032E5144D
MAERLTDEPTGPNSDPAGSARPLSPAEPDTPEGPETLLLRALGSLPEAQRHDVLRWLFERIPQAAPPLRDLGAQAPGPEAEIARSLAARHAAHQGPGDTEAARQALLFGMSDPMRGDYQMVPVRLPTADHARLRAWSQEHGFAMATIIRGLLARFLDEQHPGSPEAGTAPAG